MGQRGPVASPDAVGHGAQERPDLEEHGERSRLVEVPAPPVQLLRRQRDLWNAYWRSDIAQAFKDVDLHALCRLVRYWDEWERAERRLRKNKKRVSAGSNGQDVVPVELEYMLKLETRICEQEKRFGITPESRARLGLTVGLAQLTAEQVNRMARTPVESGDADGSDRPEVIDIPDSALVEAFPPA